MYPFFKHILAGAMVMSAVSMPAQAVNLAPDVQVMSFKVSIDGREVMAPMLGVPVAGHAEVSIGAGENDGYTLGLNLMKPDPLDDDGSGQLHLLLWRGSTSSGQPLLDKVMDVTANDPSDKPRSVEAVNGQGAAKEHVRIELVSVHTAQADSWPLR